MSDYISREAAIEAVRAYRVDAKSKTYEMYNDGIDTAISALSTIPAADVRPVVRGTWEYISFMTCRCSVCKEVFHELDGDNFCPNCGADMREAKIDG